MTAADLHDLLVTTLVRQVGGDRRRWRLAIGTLRIHSLATHPHRNWSVEPGGDVRDVAAIEALVDTIGARHPIVTTD